ncbi:enoyl-CoA hydratase [Phytoactinopolyspora alkaliphila]|uniref:enoyl-CoA hydratase n=1 Tax=Phytoactinopolyspora alkaliphila TaxID=1783498 RepID=A0A6N9YHC1_9ACTN|nr:enoyl-CoA hydratase-related protein [Phytoactinopolyspora alkaliphila]NED94327.1 enoyl-CoA hydratase [Phytoactinopolyspora alkaliphila]
METVKIRRHDPSGTVEIVLDRPDALNAVSTEHARALAAVGRGLAEDTTMRAVVLTSSSPKAFCVGADLKERASFTDDELRDQRPITRAAYTSILDLPVPTIAAIQGYALGGGFELALACDLIVVDDTAVLGLPEVSVGLVPGGGGTQLLARRIGWGRACDLTFTARRIDADEAYRMGIADRLVMSGQAREAALELATHIASNSPVGLRQAKRAMRLGMDGSLAAGLEIEDAAWRTAAFSADRKEGIAAFNEKRDPNWPRTGA